MSNQQKFVHRKALSAVSAMTEYRASVRRYKKEIRKMSKEDIECWNEDQDRKSWTCLSFAFG